MPTPANTNELNVVAFLKLSREAIAPILEKYRPDDGAPSMSLRAERILKTERNPETKRDLDLLRDFLAVWRTVHLIERYQRQQKQPDQDCGFCGGSGSDHGGHSICAACNGRGTNPYRGKGCPEKDGEASAAEVLGGKGR